MVLGAPATYTLVASIRMAPEATVRAPLGGSIGMFFFPGSLKLLRNVW